MNCRRRQRRRLVCDSLHTSTHPRRDCTTRLHTPYYYYYYLIYVFLFCVRVCLRACALPVHLYNSHQTPHTRSPVWRWRNRCFSHALTSGELRAHTLVSKQFTTYFLIRQPIVVGGARASGRYHVLFVSCSLWIQCDGAADLILPVRLTTFRFSLVRAV